MSPSDHPMDQSLEIGHYELKVDVLITEEFKEHSEEGDVAGLGWIPGNVRQFTGPLRVPQIGWNSVKVIRPHPLVEGFPDAGYCYFVNSYFATPSNPDHVIATTSYGEDFCSIMAHENIVATQFHAEKSGEIGLSLLTNFSTWNPESMGS